MSQKEGRRKKEEGRGKREEGRRKREEARGEREGGKEGRREGGKEGRRAEDRSPDRQISTFAIGLKSSQSRPNPFSTSAKFPAN
ncbi:hypothetical protein K4039_17260 [Lyngbya sp. CCAP 1446/10]|uniref:hypothetical protein n=1 Tax=Lyngbya sp. CCAP 1446/10 TaxID=439293 RepID=UPI002236F47B|nr:hypothetical protein [Lyngbya sp. CCAP 1446/10]MCW6051793.1 hypothetical protein [Lyngbya sp. CCAP 1446/10]